MKKVLIVAGSMHVGGIKKTVYSTCFVKQKRKHNVLN